MKKSLKQKVTIAISILMGVFSFLALFFSYYAISNILIKNAKEDFKMILEEHSQDVGNLFSEGHEILRAINKHPLVIEYYQSNFDPKYKEAVLTELEAFNLDEHYASIYIIDVNGNTRVSTDSSFEGQNYKFRPYFQEAIMGEYVSDVSIGVTTNKLGYYFSAPIKIKNQVVGVIVAKMHPEVVDEVVENILLSASGKVLLIDKYGVILFSSDLERKYNSLGEIPLENIKVIRDKKRYGNIQISPLTYDIIQQKLYNIQGVESFILYDKKDKEEELLTISRVGDYPFFLISEHSTSVYKSQITQVMLLFIGMLLFGGAGSVLLTRKILGKMLGPLEKLKESVEDITLGDYTKPLDIETGDELEGLGNGFNKMLERLEKTKASVEEKIFNQTNDLRKQKKSLEKQQKAMLSILEDVDAEREKNIKLADDLKKFLWAIENASDHVIITDEEGIVLYGNPAVEKITGFKIKEIMGRKAGTLKNWGGVMEDKFYEKMWDTIKNKKKTFSGEIKNKRKNGDYYDVSAHISPVLNDKGEVKFFVAIERDITKEKQIDKAKTEFVSLASHQLRTPLSAINWYAEMLLDEDVGELNDEQKEYLQFVYEGNQRMVELVNSLLNVSRLELGTFSVEPEEIKVTEVSDSVIAELMPDIKEKKMRVKKHYDKDFPLFKADKKLMRILFQNLLTNAVKYTPEKGQIDVTVTKHKGKKLCIEVKDNGYGIPADQQSKIYTKLFRADNVRSKDTGGSGLGLYLVKSIVEENKGSITFHSKEDVGTTFTILLPLSGMKKKEGAKAIT